MKNYMALYQSEKAPTQIHIHEQVYRYYYKSRDKSFIEDSPLKSRPKTQLLVRVKVAKHMYVGEEETCIKTESSRVYMQYLNMHLRYRTP